MKFLVEVNICALIFEYDLYLRSPIDCHVQCRIVIAMTQIFRRVEVEI
jgi:hypothetical protein